ncbi:hypothetical protein BU24DRAFT_425582 [Aaosphaeria arxii CBS 175.79]|uniref:Phosphatidylglycerol/phosphatidylinositol transfer protein n=1 Tax=Aaosphaeria arxii CBS 175.79 TaxID=1450172 RepID=A0A6A5XL39_9PLEO|nr:uncharacterized protein BU24DRAFT_425582 [Aaosphaeria arxii CBS 175.79]KAF2013014.1 hypothetical protein BU24DRAFT_425582 [Aaosphaeria arxii CBS 175.79]
MQLTTLLLSAVCAVSVSASPSWGPSQIRINEDFKVPGSNPLFFCADPKDNLLEIEKVDLSPNPPEAGKTLTIKATGDFKEKIDEGAKVHVQVKYGLITLINQEADLCDTITNVDLKCPLEKGEMTLSKDVELPSQIPPGKYSVLADVYTKDGDKITCLTAHVEFHR